MNWKNILTNALVAGVVIKSISDIDDWLNEKIREINSGDLASAYVEMAYEIAKMGNDEWNYLVNHLKVKSLRNSNAEHIYKFCNYVVHTENNKIRELLTYSISDASEVLAYNLRDMELHEIAAHYGILKAYSERNMKSRAILGQFNRMISN